jgi:TRAP-type C4-dicarboxylate transport system permease small subunit
MSTYLLVILIALLFIFFGFSLSDSFIEKFDHSKFKEIYPILLLLYVCIIIVMCFILMF